MKSTNPALVGAALLIVGGCTQEAGDEAAEQARQSALGPTDVATVNGERVPESVFRLYSMNSLQRNIEQLGEEEYNRLLDDLVRMELLNQAAAERGLLQERTIAAELELQRLQLIASRMAVRYLEENPPSEAEIRDVYEQNLERYLATQYKARHILLESEEEANEVIALLDEGANFAELAQERSTDGAASQGGDLGYFSADSMVPPFAAAVTGMQPGNYSSEPVQTRFGWHVILLEDVREQEPPGVEAVREELEREADRRKLDMFVEALRGRGTTTTNDVQ